MGYWSLYYSEDLICWLRGCFPKQEETSYPTNYNLGVNVSGTATRGRGGKSSQNHEDVIRVSSPIRYSFGGGTSAPVRPGPLRPDGAAAALPEEVRGPEADPVPPVLLQPHLLLQEVKQCSALLNLTVTIITGHVPRALLATRRLSDPSLS